MSDFEATKHNVDSIGGLGPESETRWVGGSKKHSEVSCQLNRVGLGFIFNLSYRENEKISRYTFFAYTSLRNVSYSSYNFISHRNSGREFCRKFRKYARSETQVAPKERGRRQMETWGCLFWSSEVI